MKKFLGCIAIYLCVTVLTACGWVFLTRPTEPTDAAAENPMAEEVIQLPAAPDPAALALNNVLSGLMTATALQLDFTVEIVEQDHEPLALTGQVYLGFDQGFTNPTVQGSLTLAAYTLDFTYQDNWLYVTAFGGNYKISTSSILEAVDLITSFTSASQVQPDQQAAEFADELVQSSPSGLDLNQILAELQNLTDRETPEGHELSFTLLGLAVRLDTDLDYRLTALATDAIKVKDYQITPAVQCTYLAECRAVEVAADNYTDLSALNVWADAVANTARLTAWHLTGNLQVDLPSLSINMSVPLDVQIKLVNHQPQVMAQVGPIPVITGVNNDVPYKFGDTIDGINPGKDRILRVYYADGYVYFYRSEIVPVFPNKSRTYEKMSKVTLDEFLADPLMLLSYGCGFSDTIMKEISKAMALAENRATPLDPNKVLQGLTLTPEELNLVLNLQELANNPQLDNLSLSLFITSVENKNYVNRAQFAASMPLSDAFTLAIACDDLTLVDINQPLDWTAATDFIGGYTYQTDEQWEASNGQWSLTSALTYTVNFESNGGAAVPAVTGPVNTTFALPTLVTWVVDDGVTHDTYTFDGWYTDPEFAAASRYTDGVITRQDLTLYAKWLVETQTYRQVIIINDLLTQRDEFKALPGTQFDLPTTFDDVQAYDFVGWYTDAACQNAWQGGNLVPDYDLTLYAKWDKVADLRTITIVDNQFNNQPIILAGFAGEALDLSSYASRYQTEVLTIYKEDGTEDRQETYTFAGFDQNLTAFPDGDVTIYVNWDCATKYYYTVTFSKNTDDKKIPVIGKMNPEEIDFPFETTMRVLEGTTSDLTPYVPTWEYRILGLGYRCNFEGWTTTRNGEAVTQVTVTADTIIYANWSKYYNYR